MSHGIDAPESSGPDRLSPVVCRFAWCRGRFCDQPEGSEKFHAADIAAEGDHDTVAVGIVCNDFADCTHTGALVDISFSSIDTDGVSSHSVGLAPLAALRFSQAVAKAALAAITNSAV